jgi:hypothetical protein
LDPLFTVHYSNRGDPYDATQAFSHFANNGFKYLYAWAFEPLLKPAEMENIAQAFNLMDAANPTPTGCVGYCAATWTKWNAGIGNPYRQNFGYNVLEIMGNYVGGMHKPRSNKGTHDSTYFGYLATIEEPYNLSTFTVDQYPVSKLDYLLVMENRLHPDIDYVDMEKRAVSFYDAVLYCNLLSEREGYSPAYTWDDIAYRGMHDGQESLKRVVTAMDNLRLDPESKGYRLPYADELAFADAYDYISTDTKEWVRDLGGSMGVSYTDGAIGLNDPASPAAGATFRVVRTGRHSYSYPKKHSLMPVINLLLLD